MVGNFSYIMRTLLLTVVIACSFSVAAQTADVKEQVLPLLTTKWGQDAPYNLQCPLKTNSKGQQQHCRVGCVACAMGQVMRYHQYPEVGIGTGTNMFNAELTADFGNTHYDWLNMRDSYRGSYSDAEADAVATLLYHCGVAVNMIYGLQSSSTFTAFANNMTTALVRYFGYDDEGLRSVNRSSYTKEEWLQMIYENLSAGQPIIYSGNSATMGGHTWVLDGYDKEGRIHMNWGWLGSSDDYYDIDLNVAGLDFNQKQSMVIGIRKPQNPTGIVSRPAAAKGREGWYTLDGRLTEKPLRKGIYVKDGRKIIIE